MADSAPMRKYEGSAADKRADKRMAKKRGMSVKAYERSGEDRAADAAAMRTLAAGRAKK
jgi:hypothetical protein